MERIEVHRGCYRASLALFKQEFGTVILATAIFFVAVMMQIFFYLALQSALTADALGIAINLSVQLLWMLCVTGPLILGVLRWFYFLPVRVITLYEIFYYVHTFERFKQAISFSFQMIWRMGLTVLAGCAPGYVASLLVERYTDQLLEFGLVYSMCIVLSEIIWVVGVGGAFYYCCGSFLSTYLLFEEQFSKATLCIHYSCASMKEHRTDVALLILSMFPISVFAVLIIPLFFLFPYLFLLCVHRGRELLDYIERHS